jgi:hypothetical protein
VADAEAAGPQIAELFVNHRTDKVELTAEQRVETRKTSRQIRTTRMSSAFEGEVAFQIHSGVRSESEQQGRPRGWQGRPEDSTVHFRTGFRRL